MTELDFLQTVLRLKEVLCKDKFRKRDWEEVIKLYLPEKSQKFLRNSTVLYQRKTIKGM